MWFILGLMGADTSLHIHTDVRWKWRALIIRVERLQIVITRSLYTDCFLSGWSRTDFPADGEGVACWRDPPHMRNHTFSLCPATRYLTSWNPSLHFIALSPGGAEDQRDKPLLVVYCHVRSRAVLAERSEYKRSKVAENTLMRSAARDCGGIKPRSVPSLEADTSK